MFAAVVAGGVGDWTGPDLVPVLPANQRPAAGGLGGLRGGGAGIRR